MLGGYAGYNLKATDRIVIGAFDDADEQQAAEQPVDEAAQPEVPAAQAWVTPTLKWSGTKGPTAPAGPLPVLPLTDRPLPR